MSLSINVKLSMSMLKIKLKRFPALERTTKWEGGEAQRGHSCAEHTVAVGGCGGGCVRLCLCLCGGGWLRAFVCVSAGVAVCGWVCLGGGSRSGGEWPGHSPWM